MKIAMLLRACAVLILVQLVSGTDALTEDVSVLKPEQFQQYVEFFNQHDQESVTNHIPNANAWDWMKANVPFFECPDKEVERTYCFRWWTYRKHIRKTQDGWVISEFLPPVGWAGLDNTIPCAPGHHFYEGRWVRDPQILDGYAKFWLLQDRGLHRYSNWLADAIWARRCVTGDGRLASKLLPALIESYRQWEKDHRDPNGLFWQQAAADGMEAAIGGDGYRATFNSYMYGDAMAIGDIAEEAGKMNVARQFREDAQRIKQFVETQLWDADAQFFKLRYRDAKTASDVSQKTLCDARELYGYVPWQFHLPDPAYDVAWKQLMDPMGFYAPFGPTTAEQRHPGFSVRYAGHDCQWCGPSWPYATAQTLTALANLLNDRKQGFIGKADYFETLRIYARSHALREGSMEVIGGVKTVPQPDPATLNSLDKQPWIDENLNPYTGEWIARDIHQQEGHTEKNTERGKDYNHSTFCDLVISGLVGLRPRADDIVEVNPLVPEGVWDYFCLDNVSYHGRNLTVLWDKTGQKYGRGSGLRVLSDGREIAHSETLSRVTGKLPAGPEALAPLNPNLSALPCKTPVGLPYSKLKAFVAGNGLLQTFEYNPKYGGMGNNRLGPGLHVLLTGLGPWKQVEQTLVCEPVPTVVTRLKWPTATMEQSVFAAAPEERGFCVRIQVTNTGKEENDYELVDVVDGASGSFTGKTFRLAPGASGKIDLQFMGEPADRDALLADTAKVWGEKLRPASSVTLPDSTFQYAFDASVRHMLTMIEWRPDHARILKGLQHYYGSNPYDTFQVSRALDQIGLKAEALELLRHQMRHLKNDGVFEMWERNALSAPGADQWIVQGLASAALWGHYELWGDEAWLKEMTPVLTKAASATLQAREGHAGPRKQGNVTIDGLLPPCSGDGGLKNGYHWSQNAGALYGTRVAAEAARRLGLAEAEKMEAGRRAFRDSLDAVRLRAVEAAGNEILPAFAGAEGDARFKSLWGIVMSVTAFGAIPPDDPAAVKTLRFLQNNKRDGLHRFLGYSNGTWPYLSAEVAQWHILIGEYEEAWEILKVITERASPTACWYEEFAESGCGDPCDIWSAAEQVYLSRLLMVLPKGDDLLLCAGLPARFMAPGKKMGVTDVPLPGGGTCSFTLAFENGFAKAEVTLTGPKRPARLRIWMLSTETGAEPDVNVTGAESWKRQGRELILEQPGAKVSVAVRCNP